MRPDCRGFTLIEIMIALAVFAVVSAALVRNASTTIYQSALVEKRTVAWWIAENHFAVLRTRPREKGGFPSVGRKRLSVTMANRDWEIVTTVSTTENTGMRRIEISVFDENDPEDSLVTLTGFLGRH